MFFLRKVSARTVFLSVDGILPIQGGLPIIVDGQFIGGIGVSGVPSEFDEQIAMAGVNALVAAADVQRQ